MLALAAIFSVRLGKNSCSRAVILLHNQVPLDKLFAFPMGYRMATWPPHSIPNPDA